MNSVNFFKENGYIVVKNFLDEKLCFLLYNYVKNEALRLAYLYENFDEEDFNFKTNLGIHGTFKDKQALGDFSKYGDPIFDTILDLKTKEMCDLTGLNLVPNYSYHRLYTTGAELKRHKDRPSCEISTTICLGYDSDYNWPIFFGPKTGETNTKGFSVCLNPGEMVIYKGHIIEHWRESFQGLNHAQMFLHYNNVNGDYNYNTETDKFDGRPLLGLSAVHRNNFSKDLNETKKKNNYE